MGLDPRLMGAITCPHPAARELHTMYVQGRNGRWMATCRACYETMKSLVRHWHAYSIRPSTVFRRLRMLDYSRRDCLQFVVQLIADRAQVRLGLLSRSQVDV